MERNRVHHGHFFSEQTGGFSVVMEEHRYLASELDEDGTTMDPECAENDAWEPEITIYLQERRQLGMIRVVGSDGTEHRITTEGS